MKETKIIIDENLSPKLASQLSGSFSSVTHVSFENLESEVDIKIWEYAKKNSWTILTKDSDFKAYSVTFDCPPKVIRINCGNRSTSYILDKLISNNEVIISFLTNESDCYLEIT